MVRARTGTRGGKVALTASLLGILLVSGVTAGVATAVKRKGAPVEATMTLHRLGGKDWRLDIENTSLPQVTIRHIRWSAPAGLKIEGILRSLGGRCGLSGSGFQCRTRLAAPSCATCGGDDLSVDFKATGPKARWVGTGLGGHWARQTLQVGHAVLTVSERRTR